MQYNTMLEEICKASTMKAATALSRFLKMPLKIDIKPVEINPIDKIKFPTYNDKNSVGLFVTINGHLIKGGSSLLIPQKAAYAICDILLNRSDGSTDKLHELEESALKEMINIVLGNFLTPFAHSLLTATLMHSPAVIETETSLGIINHIRTLMTQAVGTNHAINISFSYEHEKLKGDINIVFNSDKILSLLKDIMVLSNG